MSTNQSDARIMARLGIEGRCLSALAKDRIELLHAVGSGLQASHFSGPNYGQIFTMMVAAASQQNAGTPGDELVISLSKLADKAPMSLQSWFAIDALENTSAYAKRHTESVITYSKRDALLGSFRAGHEAVKAHVVPDWELMWEDATKHLTAINDLAIDSKAVGLCEMVDAYVAKERNPGAGRVTPTGLQSWDRYAGSLRDGELITVGARPGVGKTAFALQAANRIVNNLGKVLFFSLEMLGEELVGRLALQRAGRNGLGSHKTEVDARSAEAEALKKQANYLHVFEGRAASALSAIEARCRLHAATGRISLVVIDYLQLIDLPPDIRKQPREQQVAYITRRLKLLANELRCPIMILAQLNRDTEKEQRAPRLSDLRESGSIEQDSDRVWFLYQEQKKDQPAPSPDADTVEVILQQAKCRGGRPGIETQLNFYRPCFQFTQIIPQTTTP